MASFGAFRQEDKSTAELIRGAVTLHSDTSAGGAYMRSVT